MNSPETEKQQELPKAGKSKGLGKNYAKDLFR
jgi:hypothetical protein